MGEHLGEDQDMWYRIAMKFDIAYSNSSQAIYYRGQENSVCANLDIVQTYPIIKTIHQSMSSHSLQTRKYLEEYLVKLELDFAERLLAAGHLDSAYTRLQGCRTIRYILLKSRLLFLYIWKKYSS